MDELAAALERERGLLREGRLAGLEDAAPAKARAAARALEAQPGDGRAIGRLLDLLERNQRLLLAAGEGLRDAARRRAAGAEARGRLATYDRQGARAAPAPPPRVERRA